MEDLAVLQAVRDAARTGRPVALATVIHTRGSVPRHAGSKMVIDPARGLVGTIGGGCGEGDVIEAARDVLATGTPRLLRIELTDAVDSWSPAVCGGIMDVFLEAVRADAGAAP
jgi:xanthine/CO dehydrogenase XdhC/CoxF family maturation factor